EAIAKVLADAPAPRLAVAGVPRELVDVVAKCLAKDKNARFSGARDLALALAPFAGADGVREALAEIARRDALAPLPPPPSSSRAIVTNDETEIATSGPSVDLGWESVRSRARSRWAVAAGLLVVAGALVFGATRLLETHAVVPAVS